MACKEGKFDVVDQSKTFSINLNAQHVNGMTPFDLALSTIIRYSRVVLRLFSGLFGRSGMAKTVKVRREYATLGCHIEMSICFCVSGQQGRTVAAC